MSPILIVCIVVSIVHLCIGTSVFLKAPRNRTNQAFYLAIISMALWIVLTSASSTPWQDLELRAFLTRLAYAAGMLTTAFVTAFCVVFASKGAPPRRPMALIALTCGFFLVLSFVPGTVEKGFRVSAAGAVEVHGPFRIPYYIALAVLFGYGIRHLYRRHVAVKFDEEKHQLRILGAGIFVPAFISLTSFVILPYFVGASLFQSSIGPISTVILIVLAGYATLRQGRFIEVDLALAYVFDSIEVGICVTQLDGRIVRHNKRFTELLEYPGKLAGYLLDDLADFLGPNMEERASRLRAWLKEKQPDSIEITLSGLRNKTLELTAGPLTNNWGKPVGKVLLFRDITEKKTLKEELRASEEKYRTLVENADDIIYTLDLEGNFTFFNDKASQRITGHKAEEWLGRNFRELVVPGEEEHILECAREAANKGTPQRFEAKILHKTGKALTLWNCLTPIIRDGKPVGYSVIARDITETKELEQKLKESEEKYRTLVEEAENIVYIIQDGRLRFVNGPGVEFGGYTEEELYSDGFDLLQLIHPDDHVAVATAMAVLAERRSAHQRLEARFVSKRGEVYDFILTGASLTYRGKPAIMGVLVDITEKKKLQGQLIQSEKLASIGQLVSGVAHELNNPLAAIMGYAQLFSENEALPPKERESAQKMFESSERCKKIIQNLLSFARRQEIHKTTLEVNEILDRAVELREYNLRSHDIEIRRRYQTDLKTVVGDPHHLQSVFLNIINNASDAMRNGNGKGILKIATRLENNSVVVEFADNGPGIPPEFRDKVFDPFFTTKEVGKGTGLGLSISYGIIKEHGGELFLDRSYDGGSKFMIKLPVGQVPEEEKPAVETALVEQARNSQPRILVVDDEETILDLSVDILAGKGYQVETALTGEIAKEMLESNCYDLVIADIRMPGVLSGIDLFQWAKRHKPGMEERIVFATGDIVADETRKFLSETRRPCLSKPFEMSEYLSTIQKALGIDSGNAA